MVLAGGPMDAGVGMDMEPGASNVAAGFNAAPLGPVGAMVAITGVGTDKTAAVVELIEVFIRGLLDIFIRDSNRGLEAGAETGAGAGVGTGAGAGVGTGAGVGSGAEAGVGTGAGA